MKNRLRVFAPASASNLGPGFDVLGLALEKPGDIVEAERSESTGVEIVEVTGAPTLSADSSQNTAAIAAQAVLDRIEPAKRTGVRLWVHKRMPLASGLGSSAASSVAGALVVNELCAGGLSRHAMVDCALEGEKAVSGTAHADNVAPSLLGGIVLIRSYAPLDLVSLPVPEALRIVVIHPHAQVQTSMARQLVADRHFTIKQAVTNLGNVAAFVAALHSGDLMLFGRSIHDALVEPIRAPLVTGFAEVKTAALAAGALGCSISGSGPSVFAFAAADGPAERIAETMQQAFLKAGVTSDRFVGRVNTTGARVLSAEDE